MTGYGCDINSNGGTMMSIYLKFNELTVTEVCCMVTVAAIVMIEQFRARRIETIKKCLINF